MNKQKLKKLGIDTDFIIPGGVSFFNGKLCLDKTTANNLSFNDIACISLKISAIFDDKTFYVKGHAEYGSSSFGTMSGFEKLTFCFLGRKVTVSFFSEYNETLLKVIKNSRFKDLSSIHLFDSSIDHYSGIVDYEFSCKDLVAP